MNDPVYVDQVVRKQRFLAQHPEAIIELDREGSPYKRWHGRMPGCQEVATGELSELLDRLEDLADATKPNSIERD